MLKVTPQINEGNAVQMVIEQEVSKVEGQTSLDVVFGERKLKTTVLANDGELIVLGGLMTIRREKAWRKCRCWVISR